MFSKHNVFETGLSDFYKLTFTVLKAYFQKQKPNCLANSIILPPELFLSSRNGTLKHFNANCLREKMDLLLFLRPAKCLIYPGQFLVAF